MHSTFYKANKWIQRILILSAVLLFTLNSYPSFSQGIKGTITNSSGDPVPYANIYINELTRGTTSNIDGNYELKLPAGTFTVTFQYLGYKTQEHTLAIKDHFETHDVVLQKRHYEIPEVVVYADDEDPAYRIMRKAIAMAPYFKSQVEAYDCRVYLKGTGVLSHIPALLKKRLKKEGLEEGEYFVTENISNIHFELPNITEQEVISVRSNQYSDNINPMSYITLNSYQDYENPITPLDKRAFSVYDFKLVNGYYDKERLIHKIQVIPKREGNDLFEGYIHIAQDFWNIHTVDLTLEQKMFRVTIRQIYAPVKGEIWMPVSHHIDANFSAMGFEGRFQYAGSVDYKSVTPNKTLDHSFLSKIKENLLQRQKEREEVFGQVSTTKNKQKWSRTEKKIKELSREERLSNRESRKLNRLMKKKTKENEEKPPLEIKDRIKIGDSARSRTVSYWDSIRPIPLTEAEKNSYVEKDSIDLLMEDPEYKDSIRQARKKFRWTHLITGHTYPYEEKNSKLSFRGLVGVRSVSFNTVDGFLYRKYWDYNKSYDNGRKWSLEQNLSYAFSREAFMSDATFRYRYNGMKRAWFSIHGGRQTSDFKSANNILPGVNMLTSLFLKENYGKLFEEDFIALGHTFDIINGLKLETQLRYANRTRLYNNSDFYFTDFFGKNEYSSNVPDHREITPENTGNHTHFQVNAKASYTPRYYYKVKDHVKEMQYSRYPTFSLGYKGGFNGIGGSDSRFDFGEFTITDYGTIKGLGQFSYQLGAGTFFTKKELYFADFKHFSANTPFLAPHLSTTDFRVMDYYKYSTNKSFAEAHLQFRNDRILLKRLPVLNNTLMMESLYVHYLKIPDRKNYLEVGYGLNQVFLLFNLEIFAGFEGSQHVFTGGKICIPLFSGSQTVTIIGN